ncbi:glycosyl transferase [Bifidobacterium hapali]|uniref:Glycosyl transferase n=1 Tax=Bifidobacterium hapali TaxID=1630172 RepID=A0A261G436_9BIFI|nr:glycosyltransferase family 2 protein [Bifidobacterium hapali]OZG66172.1 glycosyl transferase [Bifidobacterium hapali]
MTTDMPLVSVLVCIYNTEQYLADCIDSICGQTYDNLEIVLVDDGSTDRSGAIIDEYAEKDKRIKAVHQKNAGFSGCRNACMDHATGEFIAFVDSDDIIMPDFVEYMLSIQRQTGADMVISKNCFTNVNMQQVSEDHIVTWSPDKAVSEFFYPRVPLGSWNKLYRRDFLNRNGLRFVPQLTTGEGLQFITRAASLANCIGVGSRKVYRYRMNNPNSATTKADVERQGIGSLKTMDYIEHHLPVDSQIVRSAMRWHRWSCYNYCLRQIMNAEAERQYASLYRDCVRHLRADSLAVSMLDLPWKHRLIVLISSFSPRLGAQCMISKKQRLLARK